MTNTGLVRRIDKTEWREYREVRLRALKDSPDAFGSTLEDAARIPESAWQSRLDQASPETDLPITAVVGEAFVGLAWAKIESPTPDIVHLYQMWVDPGHRGLGIGRALVETVVEWAGQRKAQSIVLQVTCGDRPARRLYDAMGFRPSGSPIPLRPGSDLLEQPMELELMHTGT